LEARDGDVRSALLESGVVINTWSRGGDWANLQLSLRRVFGLLAKLGDHRSAAVLFGALDASGATSALPFAPVDAHELSDAVRKLRVTLGDDEFNAAVAAGVSLSAAELMQFLQSRVDAHGRDERTDDENLNDVVRHA